MSEERPVEPTSPATAGHDPAGAPASDAGEDATPPATSGGGLSRRELLLASGMGTTLLLGGGSALLRSEATAAEGGYVEGGAAGAGHAGHGGDELEALGVERAGYGHGPAAPHDLDEELIASLTHPPAPDGAEPGALRELRLPVTAEPKEVAAGVSIDAWVYGGRLPGPVIRATEGDRLRIEVPNHTANAHNLHLHGSHDPQMDGWEPIPAGGSFTYEIEARPAGVHPYHCHTPPLAEHVRRGLYGVMIVDPPGGREPALEVVLVLCGFDVDGDGRNELYAFNGICGLYDRHPIQVPVDELVRVYVVNMIESEPIASFHLHAQTFDVYRTGTGTRPDEHTDQVTLSQGERAMLEFRLPRRGRYMFHPHQHHVAERGAMGWFTAV